MSRSLYGRPLRYGNLDDFQTLKTGNVIAIEGIPGTFTCVGSPYYNHDTKEPSWEVKTNKGIIDIRNDIIVIK